MLRAQQSSRSPTALLWPSLVRRLKWDILFLTLIDLLESPSSFLSLSLFVHWSFGAFNYASYSFVEAECALGGALTCAAMMNRGFGRFGRTLSLATQVVYLSHSKLLPCEE